MEDSGLRELLDKAKQRFERCTAETASGTSLDRSPTLPLPGCHRLVFSFSSVTKIDIFYMIGIYCQG